MPKKDYSNNQKKRIKKQIKYKIKQTGKDYKQNKRRHDGTGRHA